MFLSSPHLKIHSPSARGDRGSRNRWWQPGTLSEHSSLLDWTLRPACQEFRLPVTSSRAFLVVVPCNEISFFLKCAGHFLMIVLEGSKEPLNGPHLKIWEHWHWHFLSYSSLVPARSSFNCSLNWTLLFGLFEFTVENWCTHMVKRQIKPFW